MKSRRLSIRQSIGGYRVERVLEAPPGRGSFLVSRGTGTRRARYVLKWIGRADAVSLADCLRADMRDLAAIGHPALGLPVAFGRDADTGRPYIVRPYILGSEILLGAQSRSLKELFPWLVAAAEALSLLHDLGFLHRNVKPSNLIVTRKALRDSPGRETKIILCDPAWWPEGSIPRGGAEDEPLDTPIGGTQGSSGEGASAARDLHALGAVFHALLTGGATPLDEIAIPAAPSRVRADVPLDLDRIVLRLLHPDPELRYGDARALVADLRLLSGARSPPRPTPAEVFVDREAELATAIEALRLGAVDKGGGPRPMAVAVAGEAGMGKTAFLRRLVLEAQISGFRAVQVRCYPESLTPLAPLAEISDGLLSLGSAGRTLRTASKRLFTEGCREEGAAAPAPGARQRFLCAILDLFSRAVAAEPTVICVDDAHSADPLTLDFLSHLVRDVGLWAPEGEISPPSVVVSYRTESPFRHALRPLLEALRNAGSAARTIELRPIEPPAVRRWLDLVGAPLEEGETAALGGLPLAIREAIRFGGPGTGEAPRAPRDLPTLHGKYLESLQPEARRILELLAVLGRPAPEDLLAEALELPPPGAPGVRSALETLLRDAALSEESGRFFFQHGSFRAWMDEGMSARDKVSLCRRIAEILEARDPGAVEEIAHHWLAAGEPLRAAPSALAAARRLARNHEDRKALLFYEASLAYLPGADERLRMEIAEETAEAFSRTGDHAKGIEILKAHLQEPPGGEDEGRLCGKIGILAHRAGDEATATFHLEKGLGLLAGAEGLGSLRERLTILSELAEIASNRGDYGRAEARCREALDLIEGVAGDRSAEIRREEMVILETLAHLRLRRFEYEEARRLFERSLEVGESLGPIPEKGLILNNLGTLHVQQNQFHRAIECYERASRLASRLGDDQGMAIVQANLAVLEARIGDPDAADAALERSRRHEARGRSTRTRFLRLHSAGMVDLILGRYASAIEALRTAVLLGEELKDLHMTAFDLVYLGECFLYRGEAKAARETLERATGLGPPVPAPVPSMAEARRAVLAAMRGDARGAHASIAAAAEGKGGGIPYIHAWNRVYTGWARRILGESEDALPDLEEAAAFFAQAKVPAGEIHAVLEASLADAASGAPTAGERRLTRLRSRFACGRGPLKNPMLAARLLGYDAKLKLAKEPPEAEEAASLLLEAEGYLVGRHLRDLEKLAAELREKIRGAGPLLGRGMRAGQGVQGLRALRFPRAPDDPTSSRGAGRAGGSPDVLEVLGSTGEELGAVLRSIDEELASEIGEERVRALCDRLRETAERVHDARRALERRESPATPPFRAASILGRSTAMRKVIALVLQVAPTPLPVLISGETGSGKELVSRAIHGESARRSRELVSINCAAIPGQLLEAQLFGYVKGAFTGAEEDRPGLLEAASGGTFLFDEIGELPLDLQAKLLRVLDRRLVRPVGSSQEVEVDVRFLFATNRDLRALVREGRFRADLLFRLGAFEIPVPALRDRLEDLPLLVEHFRSLAAGEGAPRFDDESLRVLAAHPWPGNVRELENVVTRLSLTSTGDIAPDQVRQLLGSSEVVGLFPATVLRSRPLDQLVAQLEREYLVQLHRDSAGDLDAMAGRLGITVRSLYNRFRRLGIRPKEI